MEKSNLVGTHVPGLSLCVALRHSTVYQIAHDLTLTHRGETNLVPHRPTTCYAETLKLLHRNNVSRLNKVLQLLDLRLDVVERNRVLDD